MRNYMNDICFLLLWIKFRLKGEKMVFIQQNVTEKESSFYMQKWSFHKLDIKYEVDGLPNQMKRLLNHSTKGTKEMEIST